MRLGASPAAASTPTGVFNQRFEALFPHAGALGCTVCFTLPTLPPFLPVYLCMNVGPQGLLAVALPAPFVPQSATFLDLAAATQFLGPGRPSAPLLLVWMNVSSLSPWLLDLHAVRFSVSSGCFLFLNFCCPSFGCVRRHSMSTYASILAGTQCILFFFTLLPLKSSSSTTEHPSLSKSFPLWITKGKGKVGSLYQFLQELVERIKCLTTKCLYPFKEDKIHQ